jgi:ComF family protein
MGKAEALRHALTTFAKATVVKTTEAVLTATLAPRCVACARVLDAPLDGPVCPLCWHEARCAAGRYDGALREVIHAFKYEGRRSLALPLGAILKAGAAESLAGADCAVPVPLYPWRRLQRGFNQAADLAGALDLPVVHALWRTRATAPQTGLTAGERRRNVGGAFRLSPLLSDRTHVTRISDCVVVLVGDVMTTGATMEACAGVLRNAGAREVRIATVARAMIRNPRT